MKSWCLTPRERHSSILTCLRYFIRCRLVQHNMKVKSSWIIQPRSE